MRGKSGNPGIDKEFVDEVCRNCELYWRGECEPEGCELLRVMEEAEPD